MTTKERLHHLVEELPEGELDHARRYLEYLRVTDPLVRKQLERPEDDEKLTHEDRMAIRESEENLMAVGVFSHQEPRRGFSLPSIRQSQARPSRVGLLTLWIDKQLSL